MALLRKLHKLLEGVGVGEALLQADGARARAPSCCCCSSARARTQIALAVIATDARGARLYRPRLGAQRAAAPKLKYRLPHASCCRA